ncbi:MAG: DUF3006 domain-containing protein [Clostridia bacterium]|nr:DUF3006 domain-containing protein [Clostridia bacterium]
MQDFINELSNYLKNNIENNIDDKWNNLSLNEDLTLYDEKIIVRFRDQMLTNRSKILQNYAQHTKEKGEMFYIYDKPTNQKNTYNLSYCNINRNHEVLTKSIEELPAGSKLGSVLRKKGENFIIDIEATKEVGKEINSMIKEKIKEQREYLNSKRIDGHIYEVGEKYSGRIWLYDLNNILGGGIEGIEEVEFPKDLYQTAKEGDLFIYENGEYKKNT